MGDRAEGVRHAVLAAVADEQRGGRRSAARRSGRRRRSSPSGPRGSSISPASQCAPWIAHGTTCSSRQKAARRAPGSSCRRQPSSRSISLPHQVQLSVDCDAMAEGLRIIVLEGDETGQELLEQALRVLAPDVTRVELELEHYDLSLDNRRATDNEVVTAAAEAMREARFGLKAATVTPEGSRRRRQPQPHPARGDRRQGDHPHRPPHPRRDAGRRRALPDRGRADGRRRRLRRRAVARGGGRRRDRLPHRAHLAAASAARSPSTASAPPRASTGASTAGRSGRSARSTRGCSRRRWTPPPSATPRSPTTRC